MVYLKVVKRADIKSSYHNGKKMFSLFLYDMYVN